MLKNMKNSKYSRKYLKVKTKQKKWAFAFKRKYHFNEIQFKTKNGHLQLNENIISMKYNVRYKENKRMIQINKIKKKENETYTITTTLTAIIVTFHMAA